MQKPSDTGVYLVQIPWDPTNFGHLWFFILYSDLGSFGGFLKQGYPQIMHFSFNRIFRYKPSSLGYPYLWKPHLDCDIFRDSENTFELQSFEQSPQPMQSKFWTCCLHWSNRQVLQEMMELEMFDFGSSVQSVNKVDQKAAEHKINSSNWRSRIVCIYITILAKPKVQPRPQFNTSWINPQ